MIFKISSPIIKFKIKNKSEPKSGSNPETLTRPVNIMKIKKQIRKITISILIFPASDDSIKGCQLLPQIIKMKRIVQVEAQVRFRQGCIVRLLTLDALQRTENVVSLA